MANIQLAPQAAYVQPNTPIEDFEEMIGFLCELQRAINWQIGDCSLAVERQHPTKFHQAYPVWVSPDMVDRCKGVARAYSPEERNINATWTIHSQMAKRPDRVAAVAATVEAGQTSDEARRDPPPPQEEPNPARATTETEAVPAVTPVEEAPAETAENPGWLLAVDVNYYAHKRFAKAGIDTAAQTVEWMERVLKRLQAKGLTDVVFCFDSTRNHRRALTEGWVQPYKERTKKSHELVEQLELLPELLKRNGHLCVSIDGMEADDLMASYAKQFAGKVTLMTADKDLRQCLLNGHCNILRDCEWKTHEETGNLIAVEHIIVEKWTPKKLGEEKPYNVTCHMTDVTNYQGAAVVGISPELWPHLQALAGDSGDDIDGVKGIGGKIAMDLILVHGTVQNVIAACKDNTAELTPKMRMKVIDFEPFAETTLKLTTLRTDLDVPKTTKLCMADPARKAPVT